MDVKKLLFGLVAFAAVQGGALLAQNPAGDWQGTLQPPNGRPAFRIVIKISRAADESLKAALYNIDAGGQSASASAISHQGGVLKMTVAALGGAEFEGKLSPEGNSLSGTWKQSSGQTVPLNLVRATPETAWAIPEPPPPPRLMPADAKPTFEVATIKPSRPDAQGKSILVGRGGTNLFTTTNTTLHDLIVFAYGVHARQVSGGPGWLENDRYDLTGKPDLPGSPSVTQLKDMVQKLLVERFQLTFHNEKKELSAYAISLGKTGATMSKSEANRGILPGFSGRGPGNIAVRNSTMLDFAAFLQSRILDRPVVDKTGLTDRFDFSLRWTPDQAPGAAGPNASPPPPDNADAPPDLFTAFQQQLGLKLESTKAPVDVMVIDRAMKPSDN
jgi:uncharacterized protein (TIGR03435 family)